MTVDEFRQWCEFYRDYPFDDFHRFHRPAALVSVSMAGGDIDKKLDWLQPPPIPEGMSTADVLTMRAFGFKQPGKDDHGSR
jgi:hypothetical protein